MWVVGAWDVLSEDLAGKLSKSPLADVSRVAWLMVLSEGETVAKAASTSELSSWHQEFGAHDVALDPLIATLGSDVPKWPVDQARYTLDELRMFIETEGGST